MKISWLQVARIGAGVVGQIVPGVTLVEQLAERLPSLTGGDKKQAIIDLVKNGVLAAEGLTSKDFGLDPELTAGVGGIVDAVVAFHNLVARKVVAPPAAP